MIICHFIYLILINYMLVNLAMFLLVVGGQLKNPLIRYMYHKFYHHDDKSNNSLS